MQFTEGTARRYGVDPWNVESSINGAARLLADNYRRFGSWDRAISAYNTGGPWNPAYANRVMKFASQFGGIGSSGGAPSAAGAASYRDPRPIGDRPDQPLTTVDQPTTPDPRPMTGTSGSSDGGARTSMLEAPDAQAQPVAMLQSQGETADVPGTEKVSSTDPGAVEAAAGNDKQPTNEQFQALVDAYSAVRRKQKFPPMSRPELERTVRGMIAERGVSGVTSLLQGGPAGKTRAATPAPAAPEPSPLGKYSLPKVGTLPGEGRALTPPAPAPTPAPTSTSTPAPTPAPSPPPADIRARPDVPISVRQRLTMPGQQPAPDDTRRQAIDEARAGRAPIAPGKTGHPAVDRLHPAHNRENLKKALTADPQNPPAGPPRDQNGLFPYNSVWGRGFTLPQLIYNLKHANPGMDDATLGEALELARPMLTAAATENYHIAMQQAREEGISAGLEKEKMAEAARSDLQSQKDEEAMRRQQVKTDAYLKVSDAAQKIRSDRYSQLQSQFDQLFAQRGMEKQRAFDEKLKTDAATIQYHLDQIQLGQRRISDTELRNKISTYWEDQKALLSILRTKSQAGGQFGPDEPLRSQILNALDERKTNIDAQVAAWAKANEASPGEVTAPAATETPATPPLTLKDLGISE
jgi:hypothetical protein